MIKQKRKFKFEMELCEFKEHNGNSFDIDTNHPIDIALQKSTAGPFIDAIKSGFGQSENWPHDITKWKVTLEEIIS